MKRASVILLLFCIPIHYQCVSKKTNQPSFINSRYVDARPLVQLTNMGNFSELSQSFALAADEDIQIYAVGEILYNMPDTMKKYYLEGDDIELFFAWNKQLIFSYGDDKKKFMPPGVIFKWKNIDDVKYVSEIQIPWSVLGIQKPVSDTAIGFDIGIGDNDDGFMQKSKLTWQSGFDCMNTDTSGYGKLYLTNKQEAGNNTGTNRLLSVKNTPVIDGLIEDIWSEATAYPVKNIAYG
ncbi:MAG: sugar-binding protein, partial [Flavitalea sp.]